MSRIHDLFIAFGVFCVWGRLDVDINVQFQACLPQITHTHTVCMCVYKVEWSFNYNLTHAHNNPNKRTHIASHTDTLFWQMITNYVKIPEIMDEQNLMQKMCTQFDCRITKNVRQTKSAHKKRNLCPIVVWWCSGWKNNISTDDTDDSGASVWDEQCFVFACQLKCFARFGPNVSFSWWNNKCLCVRVWVCR